MKTCCIIIPIYNRIPGSNEVLSIRRNCTVLKDYDIFFIHPFLMDVSAYETIISEIQGFNIHFRQFKKRYFKSNKSYSRLLLSEEFYRSFMDYEYMLIAQTDTYILNTDLSLREFIEISREKSYDYWGAPWPEGPFSKPYTLKDRFKLLVVKDPSKVRVGNGGFSLRHVMHSYDLVRKKRNLIDFYWRFNEDMFFSWFSLDMSNNYRAASFEEARTFALESDMRKEIDKGNRPYAVHAWEKYYPELV